MSQQKRGWLTIPRQKFTNNVRDALTIYDGEGEQVKLYEEVGEETVRVPRSLWAALDMGVPVVAPPATYLTKLNPIKLRAVQEKPVSKIVTVLYERLGAVLQAACGQGKTVMALEVARRLDLKTVVLVHKSFLLDQWKERIAQFLPGTKVGIWQKDSVASGKEYDIVIAMVQSLTARGRRYPDEVYASFGLVITDEVHRFAAPVWQQAITRFPAKFRLGLSATLERRDGMEAVFFRHIGPVGASVVGQPLSPKVYRINTGTKLTRSQYTNPWDGEVNMSKLVSALAKDVARTKMIVGFVARAARTGRKVLVLSDRRAHITAMRFLLQTDLEGSDITVGEFVGGLTEAQRHAAAICDIIIGTYAMAQEGLDIEALDTLALATPKTSIQQSVGRIQRIADDKKEPVVVDFVDELIGVCEGMSRRRDGHYSRMGLAISQSS